MVRLRSGGDSGPGPGPDEAGSSGDHGGIRRFPLAAQPEIMRAAEKDDQYASFIHEACRDAFRHLFGTRIALAYQKEVRPFLFPFWEIFVITALLWRVGADETCWADALLCSDDWFRATNFRRGVLWHYTGSFLHKLSIFFLRLDWFWFLISDFEEASFLFNFRLLDLMGSLLHQLDALCSYCIRLQFRISPRGLGSLYLFFFKTNRIWLCYYILFGFYSSRAATQAFTFDEDDQSPRMIDLPSSASSVLSRFKDRLERFWHRAIRRWPVVINGLVLIVWLFFFLLCE